jgi:hypothetical protein
MEFILHNKRLLRPIDTELFRGWTEETDHKILEQAPTFIWKGAKIPFDLWSQVVCFLRWTQEQFKEEALITLFYHPADRKWAAWAFPQEPNGMTIKSLPELQQYKDDRAQFGAGWIQAGSVHHHCTTGAFQSGTDTADEINRDGVHITLGHMDKPVLDTHVRQIFDGLQGETSLLNWIDIPEFLKDIPSYLKYEFTAFAIKAVRDMPFPDEWKSRIYEKPVSFPNGNHHPESTARTALTLVTAGPTITKTNLVLRKDPIGDLENKKDKKHHKRATRTSIIGSSWDEQCITIINNTCNRLNVAIPEMYQLCSFRNDTSRTDDDHQVYEEFCRVMKRSGIPMLHAEKLLFQLWREGG